MLQGTDDPHFFSVAQRKLPHSPGGIQLQPFTKPLRLRSAVLFSKLPRELQNISYPHTAVEHGFGRQVADFPQQLSFVGFYGFSENRGGAAGRGDQAQQRSDHGAFPGAVGADKAEKITFGNT